MRTTFTYKTSQQTAANYSLPIHLDVRNLVEFFGGTIRDLYLTGEGIEFVAEWPNAQAAAEFEAGVDGSRNYQF
jgi:hypothetical protein